MKKLIELRDLQKHYPVRGGILRHQVGSVKALDGIDLNIYRGECLGLVGESGCGKTTTGKAIIRHNVPIALACTVVLVVMGLGLMRIETSVHLIKMFDGEAEIIIVIDQINLIMG